MEITNIQFFDQTFTNQVSENDFEKVEEYSANIVINDEFMIQVSGYQNEANPVTIPSSNEQSWGDAKLQDDAVEKYSDFDFDAFLEVEGVENNFNWLSENANETY